MKRTGETSASETYITPTIDESHPSEIILVKPDITEFRDGYILPKEIYEPFIKGQLREVITTALEKPGNKLTIRGSTALKMLFGVYAYDPTTKAVPAELRSDLDVLADREIIERIEELANIKPGETSPIAKSVQIGEYKLDLSTWEKIRTKNLQGINELRRALATNAALEQRFSADLNVLEAILNSVSEDGLAIFNSYFLQNTISVTFKLISDGQLEVKINDPNQVFQSDAIQTADAINKATGEFRGYQFTQVNEASFEAVALDILLRVENAEFFDLFPVLVIKRLHQLVKDSAELGIDLYPAHGVKTVPFYFLQQLSDRLDRRDAICKITTPNKGEFKLYEWYTKETQEAYARAVQSDILLASLPMFAEFSMGNEVIPYASDFFRPLRDKLGPGMAHARELTFIADEELQTDRFSDVIPQIRALQKLYDIASTYFGYQELNAGSLTGGVGSEHVYTPKNPPKSVSEIIALILVSIGGTNEQVKETIQNWKISGKHKYMWKLSEDEEFDQSLDEQVILDTMEKMKAL